MRLVRRVSAGLGAFWGGNAASPGEGRGGGDKQRRRGQTTEEGQTTEAGTNTGGGDK